MQYVNVLVQSRKPLLQNVMLLMMIKSDHNDDEEGEEEEADGLTQIPHLPSTHQTINWNDDDDEEGRKKGSRRGAGVVGNKKKCLCMVTEMEMDDKSQIVNDTGVKIWVSIRPIGGCEWYTFVPVMIVFICRSTLRRSKCADDDVAACLAGWLGGWMVGWMVEWTKQCRHADMINGRAKKERERESTLWQTKRHHRQSSDMTWTAWHVLVAIYNIEDGKECLGREREVQASQFSTAS